MIARRAFLTGVMGLGGLGLMPIRPHSAAAEPPLRFYSLRLHEGGIVKSSPNKIIAQGTDWRFLNELKRELKS
jgi:hypothetical protein